ncbi:hypothetical protein [Methylobacterium radiotolerans]|uniref:hypothetical protein n=1 Tax=Methylobacterium radiotolerans TaxID=31998 RepID=UPI0038D033B2
MLTAQIDPANTVVTTAESTASTSYQVPLILDLDGTLLRADVLYEKALSLVRADPLNIFKIVYWSLGGRAYLKRRMAQDAKLDIDTLPVNAELIEFAQTEANGGRPVHMSTATDNVTAAQIARRFPFITGSVHRTDPDIR